MGLRLWDFRCDDCGHEMPGTPFVLEGDERIPEQVECPKCRGAATWATIGKPINGIHQTHSGRKYGEFDPQFGCVVESYGHKKQLMRERGLEELPPETHEQVQESIYEGQRRQAEQQAQRDSRMLVADDEDELMGKIAEQDRRRGWQEPLGGGFV